MDNRGITCNKGREPGTHGQRPYHQATRVPRRDLSDILQELLFVLVTGQHFRAMVKSLCCDFYSCLSNVTENMQRTRTKTDVACVFSNQKKTAKLCKVKYFQCGDLYENDLQTALICLGHTLSLSQTDHDPHFERAVRADADILKYLILFHTCTPPLFKPPALLPRLQLSLQWLRHPAASLLSLWHDECFLFVPS